jgi:hypothetical protein
MKALAAACAVALLVSIPLRAQDAWTEQRTVPDDADTGAQFGCAASLDGSLALIGADGENGSHGAAYFYEKSGSAWTVKQRIQPDDPNAAEFGFRAVLRDDVAIVTADMAGPNIGQGAAYVFSPDGAGTWTQTQILSLADGTGFDNFGSAITLDGDRLVIGAHGTVIGGDQFGQGAAYFFARSDSGWSQVQQILADDGALNDNFGNSAAMVGDTLFIGANAATVDSVFAEGAVYVYTYDGQQWNQVQKLTETSGAQFDFFGISLAFDGTTLMVGATESGGGPGSVYVFTNDGTSWVQQQRLTVDDLVPGANFGNAIALHGGGALIGADIQTVDGFTYRGAAYLFKFDGASWTLDHTFISSDGTTDDFFGLATDYDGTTALITTLHPNQMEGAAYFYTNDTLFADGFDG